MNIKNYILKLIKKKKTDNAKCLSNNINRFTYLSSSIGKSNIEIILSDDNIGGYYEKKLILPKEINVSKNEYTNIKIYIYKIIFSLKSKELNLYLPINKRNLDYILLTTLLTVKKINSLLYKDYPNIKNIINPLYKLIDKKRKNIKNLSGRQLLLEIIIKKLMYQKVKIKINLTKNEKIWLYQLENIKNINEKNLKILSKSTYDTICNIHSKYHPVELNQIWGYLYYKEPHHAKINLNKKIKNNINKNKNKTFTNSSIKKTKLDADNKNKNNLNTIFEYKKTIDKYNNQKNKNVDNENIDNLDILNNININQVTRDNTKTNSIFSTQNINSIIINNAENKKNNNKKFTYKEWDVKTKNYKQFWCHVYEKNVQNKIITKNEKIQTAKFVKKHKKEIMLFQEKFQKIVNKKTWIKRQTQGEELDLDTIIDNYKNIEQNNFQKIYKYKKHTNKDICIILIFDSSLSTDSYKNNEKILDLLKSITLITGCGINKSVKNFAISSFYSNTRHDCKYINIKNFTDSWEKKKNYLININPNGYTRIGPAIRHSIYKLKKFKNKKKIILLLSDGKPTDYDEYEGWYGINDIKKAISEASKEKITVKCILTDKNKQSYFPLMFGLENYYLINKINQINTKLIKIFNDIIKG